MFVDHAGYFLLGNAPAFRAICRGAAPIFLFLAGFASSYRFKWDIFALAALMSVSDFLLAGHLRTQNILFTILLSRAVFAWLERSDRRIEHPYEWYIGSLALFMSVFIVQYGSFGFLFAISGYLKRHRQYYPEALPRYFLIASFVTYGIYTQLFSQFPAIYLLLMILTLYGVYQLLSRLTIHAINGPPPLLRAGKWVSYYSGYIYAFHLIALEWITGHPF
jgi:hypothetical protein